ncbi:MAG: LON peptidase substrate-binding domain-containing protein [Proteobacteria bacterium]|nr:LON peptidase substrate-binding domain-containing protein [Pseudomonadota bacterium]
MKHYATVADLPGRIPLFPLAGALLLPRADLPLTIFEPRYLAMVEDAMAGNRIIGMIQPVSGDESDKPTLLKVGCAGRITSYAEAPENRLLISLTGICRFELVAEHDVTTAYRQADVTYGNFAADLISDNGARAVNRDALITAFRQYLEANNMSANWEEVEQIPTEALVNTLSQLAPYPAPEKQALLEASDLRTRADMLIAMTELSLSRSSGQRPRLQ